MYFPSETNLALVVGLVVVFGFFAWRAALPKPIPGIPYNREAAKQIFGDIPDVQKFIAAKGGFLAFMGMRCDQLNSPVVQVFMKPFQGPFVVVRDSRECYDILNRRIQEFDQSEFFRTQLTAIFPNSTVTMPTNDQWRYNRKLTAETMSPTFLRDVAAPIIHSYSRLLVDLWSQKMKLAKGRPFDSDTDIPQAFNDIIWRIIFGTDVGTIREQFKVLSGLQEIALPANIDSAAIMPEGNLPEIFTAFKQVLDSGYISRESPLGRLHHEFAFRFYPSLSRAWRLKNAVVKQSVQQAWSKYSTSDREMGQPVNSAVEFVIQREVRQAKREGRTADTPSKYLEGELTALLGGGFETTSASMKWAVKYLTAFPAAQQKIRDLLRTIFPKAIEEQRDPTPEELYHAQLVYLDAFVEEILRHSHLLPAATRTALTNTEILGYPIPQGTTIIMLLSPEHNPTYSPSSDTTQSKSQSGRIEEAQRTTSSKEYKAANEHWDLEDLQVFRPERYLVQDPKTGQEKFDAFAAPALTFGGGIRACFGKKMAYLNMRIMIALIVWHFDLMEVPEEFATFKLREGNVVVPEKVFLKLQKI